MCTEQQLQAFAHLHSIRQAYADAKAAGNRRGMRYNADAEMWWFAHYTLRGDRR
jgi:hypothetical protein